MWTALSTRQLATWYMPTSSDATSRAKRTKWTQQRCKHQKRDCQSCFHVPKLVHSHSRQNAVRGCKAAKVGVGRPYLHGSKAVCAHHNSLSSDWKAEIKRGLTPNATFLTTWSYSYNSLVVLDNLSIDPRLCTGRHALRCASPDSSCISEFLSGIAFSVPIPGMKGYSRRQKFRTTFRPLSADR